ncbi:hypothetical protein QBC39DRAFT_81608 [Podospora conica]|nr:hypothetical protein QBC39DRAFT_81608 [Schizothecium conicum]
MEADRTLFRLDSYRWMPGSMKSSRNECTPLAFSFLRLVPTYYQPDLPLGASWLLEAAGLSISQRQLLRANRRREEATSTSTHPYLQGSRALEFGRVIWSARPAEGIISLPGSGPNPSPLSPERLPSVLFPSPSLALHPRYRPAFSHPPLTPSPLACSTCPDTQLWPRTTPRRAKLQAAVPCNSAWATDAQKRTFRALQWPTRTYMAAVSLNARWGDAPNQSSGTTRTWTDGMI